MKCLSLLRHPIASNISQYSSLEDVPYNKKPTHYFSDDIYITKFNG